MGLEDWIPRKYNNPMTIGLVFALFVSICVIIYMMWGSKEKEATPQGAARSQPPARPTPKPSPGRAPAGARPSAVKKTETYVSNGKPTIVLIWGEWCGHSTKMKPDWDKAAETIKNGGEIDVLEFEHKKDPAEVAEAQKLPEFKGFPDIRYFPEGYPNATGVIKYAGDRTSDSIIKFAFTGGSQV